MSKLIKNPERSVPYADLVEKRNKLDSAWKELFRRYHSGKEAADSGSHEDVQTLANRVESCFDAVVDIISSYQDYVKVLEAYANIRPRKKSK